MRSSVVYQESLGAVLRGESIAWPYANDALVYREFSRCAHYHGVVGLVYYALKQGGLADSWPEEWVDGFRSYALQEAAWDAIRQRELSTVLNELAKTGVYPLLLKGTALAHTLYPEPALRHRSDTDLLVREIDRDSLSQVLVRLGYVRSKGIEGELVSSQSTFSRLDRLGISHDLDVHWRISNFQLLGNALNYDELAIHAIPVPALGPHARTLRPIDALVLACIHRLGHRQAPYYVGGEAYYDSNRLIWLYDIHLLAQSLGADQWQDFIRVAVAKQLQLLCLDGLNAAMRAFGTRLPPTLAATLKQAPQRTALKVDRFQVARWRWELSEIGALPSWRRRLKLVKEHLVPAPSYLREKYPNGDCRWLPFWYVRRALAGVWKRL